MCIFFSAKQKYDKIHGSNDITHVHNNKNFFMAFKFCLNIKHCKSIIARTIAKLAYKFVFLNFLTTPEGDITNGVY